MSPDPSPAVAIVGGGITGLAAAHAILAEAPEMRVVLFEADDQLGGKLRTVEWDAGRLEAGADSFLVREPFALALCDDLGLREELIEPAVFGGLVWDQRGARSLPSGHVMGVPVSAGDLMRNKALPLRGRLRGLADLVMPGHLVEEDVALGPFLRRRFGRSLVETTVDPILAGTRAGDPDELSLRYAMPQVYAAAKADRSVMRGLRSLNDPGSIRPRFNAPPGGMNRLVSTLEGRLRRAEIRTSAPVTSIEGAGGGFRVSTPAGSLEASSVLLAVPAPAAATALARLCPEAAGQLSGLEHASVASIGLAYEKGSLRFPAGSSGFLVPSRSGRLLSAGTWWSLKWPQAAPGFDVVRCFVGRAGRHRALDLDDDELARRAADEIGEFLRTPVRPQMTRVDRWPEGLPQYKVGHAATMDRIEQALGAHPGIELAGADYRGTGIPDCVRQGTEAARRILRHQSGAASGVVSVEGEPEKE